jgi:16S rRNA (guanine527-N7)-methyltransferase
MDEMEVLLRRGLSELGLPETAAAPMARYAQLLLETNQVMNLTAITDRTDVAALHFLDSAALLTLTDLKGKTVADVGTGAGFPGLPLKIAEPSIDLTLLDAQGKRVRFLETVCAQLGLTGVACVHGRAEEFAADRRESFDIVTSRAVAALPVLCELCLPLVKVGGCFLAMKSVDSDAELKSAQHALELLGGQVQALRDYQIPGTNVYHRLVIIKKFRKTPEKYPRAFAKIKKNPL